MSSDLSQHVVHTLGTGAIGIGIGAAVLLLCALALPRAERSATLRTPLVLLGLHVLTVLVRLPLPEGKIERGIEVLGLCFLLFSLARALFVLVVDGVVRARLSKPLPRIIRDIVQGLVYLGALAIVLREVGVEPGSLLTTSALLTAVIGLSLQETLGNLFAGLAIQAQRPFEVGDWIGLDADARLIGRVIEINWRATTVLTLEQVELIIPNGVLAKTTIRNFTKPTNIARRTVTVHAPYDASPRVVEDALLQAIQEIPGILSQPPPAAQTRGFNDNGIEYVVNYFIEDFALRDRIDSTVRHRIWHTFKRAGITIPYGMRTVHMHAVTAESRAEETKQDAGRRMAVLKAVDFLAPLPEPSLERLAGLSRTRHFMPGEAVIRQGETGSELFIVQKGELAVIVGRGEGGSVAEVARLGPGQFFGEMSLMTGEKRAATVKATTDCELVELNKGAFQEVLAADPRLVEQITRSLVDRQIALEENLSARASRSTRAEAEAKSSALLAKIRQFFQL
ncbi:mechanosensitive ion channel family protein [Polyangium sorediatum]|uniref:Mechanosensitive ion channel family protein n=1 Tax=Polyangium sorediatum TaxID=889274 RepID=A0ABT6NLK9_9BACT|nr:mechanosensitive ion channel family protein [Polyangium sorediatum]MDI1429209.1 mechanosensitive ion channel family protein [Polyangium sorediatum]